MLNEVLPWIGLALQWARAQSRFKDALYLGIVAAASFLFYALANPDNFYSLPWNEILQGWWSKAQVILAYTQLTSSGANVVNDVRGKSGQVPAALPVTNSQG